MAQIASRSHRYLNARLGIMMFLEFATWGAWVPILGNHLTRLRFTGPEITAVYGTGALATMAAPLVAGQIADRWFSTDRFLAFSHLLAAVFFFRAASATVYREVWLDSLAAMIFYAPTLGLCNSLAMRHLADPRASFARIRSAGTVGWIAAGLLLTGWFELMPSRPLSDCLRAAGLWAILHALYSLSLPRTPPDRDARDRIAPRQILAMLRQPSYAVFAALSFVLMCVLNFYYTFAGTFFEEGLDIAAGRVPTTMAIGQAAEIVTLLLLPAVHRKLGTRRTIAIGIACWALRFGVFALGRPLALVIAVQALHGVCFGFVFVVAMVWIDRISPPDARASAQSFLSFVTYGAGMWVGSIVAGRVSAAATLADGSFDWPRLFAFPCVGSLVMLAIFWVGFRPAPES